MQESAPAVVFVTEVEEERSVSCHWVLGVATVPAVRVQGCDLQWWIFLASALRTPSLVAQKALWVSILA